MSIKKRGYPFPYEKNELEKLVSEERFPKLYLPENIEFKGCKYLGYKVFDLNEITRNGLEKNIIRTNDDLDRRKERLFKSFRPGIRFDQPIPTLVTYPNSDRYILCNGFGRTYMFDYHGQDSYVFHIVEVPNEDYYGKIAAWANENCYHEPNSIEDRVNHLVTRIQNKQLKNSESAIRRYTNNVFQTLCPETLEEVVELTMERVDTGIAPTNWKTLDKEGSNHNEWVANYAMISYPEIGKVVMNNSVLGNGMRVLEQLKKGYTDKITTAIRKMKNKNMKTHFVLHTPSPKDELDLLKKRVSLLKEISSWWNDMSGYFGAPNRRRPFILMGFFPQDWSKGKAPEKKHYVSIKKVLRDANNQGIDTGGIIF